MRKSSYFIIAASALGLAACGSASQNAASDNGERRNIVALEYASSVTRPSIANNLKTAALTCWKQDLRFEGLQFASLTPRAEPEAFLLTLRSGKGSPSAREVDIVIVPAITGSSLTSDPQSSYMIQVRQRGAGPDVASAIRQAIPNGCG